MLGLTQRAKIDIDVLIYLSEKLHTTVCFSEQWGAFFNL